MLRGMASKFVANRAIIRAGAKEPQVSSVGEFADLEWAKRACLADPAIAGLIPQERRYQLGMSTRQDGAWGTTEFLGHYPSPEAAQHGAEKHAGTALSWKPLPLPTDSSVPFSAIFTDSGTGENRAYSVIDRQAIVMATPQWQPVKGAAPGVVGINFRGEGVTIGYAISPVLQASRQPSRVTAPTRPRAQQQVPVRKGQQLWVVQSGRSSVLHLMLSKTPSTPNPMSPGSIVAQLVWFGGNAKSTLCGRQATRYVSVFAPHEATCRECKRRAGFG
jgi:hypothetical protein